MGLVNAAAGFMRPVVLVGLIVVFGVIALPLRKETADTSGSVAAHPHLHGAFIQMWEDLLDESAWRNVLDAMVLADMHHTVILQRLELKTLDGKEHKYYSVDPMQFDPTRFILDYADARTDMQVYIGLREDQSFQSPQNWDVSDDYSKRLNNPEGEIRKNKDLATEVWKRYGTGKDGKHRRSFAGWYLPNEMWNQNYTETQTTELRRFHREISDHCKGLGRNNKPVAVCPYFNPYLSELPNLIDANTFGKKFGNFLRPSAEQRGAGVDVVMLQDGAGERRLTPASLQETVEPYYRSFHEMSKAKGVRFWGNVESWEYKPSFFPTNIDRLSKQIEIAGPFVEQIVTFDFFHYMNPHGHFHPGDWHEAEKSLYWCYIRKVLPDRTKLGDPECSVVRPTPE